MLKLHAVPTTIIRHNRGRNWWHRELEGVACLLPSSRVLDKVTVTDALLVVLFQLQHLSQSMYPCTALFLLPAVPLLRLAQTIATSGELCVLG